MIHTTTRMRTNDPAQNLMPGTERIRDCKGLSSNVGHVQGFTSHHSLALSGLQRVLDNLHPVSPEELRQPCRNVSCMKWLLTSFCKTFCLCVGSFCGVCVLFTALHQSSLIVVTGSELYQSLQEMYPQIYLQGFSRFPPAVSL